MTGINMWVKMFIYTKNFGYYNYTKILDFKGKFVLHSKYYKWVIFVPKISIFKVHL